jgi:hypothetical protein
MPKYSHEFWQAIKFLCSKPSFCYEEKNPFSSNPFFYAPPMGMGLLQIQVSDAGCDIIDDALENLESDFIPSSDLFTLLYLLQSDGNTFPRIEGGSHDSELLEAWKFLGVIKKSSRAALTKAGRQMLRNNMVRLLSDIWRVQHQVDTTILCDQVLKVISSSDWAIILTELDPGQRPYWAKKASKSLSFSSLKA